MVMNGLKHHSNPQSDEDGEVSSLLLILVSSVLLYIPDATTIVECNNRVKLDLEYNLIVALETDVNSLRTLKDADRSNKPICPLKLSCIAYKVYHTLCIANIHKGVLILLYTILYAYGMYFKT